MKIKLAEELEKALLRGIAEGVCKPEAVDPEELSKKAKVIYGSISYLLKKAKPPLKPASILLTATSIFGIPEEAVKAYLKGFGGLETGDEIRSILGAARDKALLVRLVNEAGSQLASGDLQVESLGRLLERGGYGSAIQSLSSAVSGHFPKPPSGLDVRSLPRICEVTRGLFGMWVIGGEPGLGKSSLAWQIALDVARNHDVAYYDLDGTGQPFFIERTRQIVGGDLGRFKRATKRIHLRETIATLDDDLSVFKPPSLIVIDSAQTLPSSIKYAKQSLDEWVKRFKGITKRGYPMLLVSEKPRTQYGEANLAGYKGTGDIEYAGSMCAQLLADEDDDDLVEFHIVKNRHGKEKGHIANLERDSKKIFWFNEERVD